MYAMTVPGETVKQAGRQPRKRGCLFIIKRILKWFGIVLGVLVVVGVIYQTVATEQDKGKFAPRGQLYTVNGHQMHIVCMGEGTPTVILQAGGAAETLFWYWVQNQLAEHTQACAFDRPGHGWSESVAGLRDGLTINAELHALLEEAGITGPYVMAGHSLGAMWTRIYAAQYPEEIAGIVLVDSAAVAAPRPFASQGEFDEWQTPRKVINAFMWGLYRTGVVRLLGPGLFQSSGYPADIAVEMAAMQSPNHVFDADYAEQVTAMWSTVESASAAEDLGDLPMAVLWAGIGLTGAGAQEQITRIRAEIATYSSNSVTQVIEGADHGSILGNEAYAQQVTDAILGVMDAAAR
ncbi:MAG: alpha/beta hydrolase [Anaerolineaceae bacterium]|nr:alpha/beta hydrolase [Anaerolineaceae bacterium]